MATTVNEPPTAISSMLSTNWSSFGSGYLSAIILEIRCLFSIAKLPSVDVTVPFSAAEKPSKQIARSQLLRRYNGSTKFEQLFSAQ